jgi:methylmalonyl-CoA mutase N-terminal domain/subunit
MDEIERLGGAVAAIEQGFYQQLIADEAYEKERRIAEGEDIVVGVNAFTDDQTPRPERFDVPPQLEAAQRDKLASLRAARDQGAVDASLAALADAARGDGDLMPPIVATVRSEATLGEICGTLRGVFGEYRPSAAAMI